MRSRIYRHWIAAVVSASLLCQAQANELQIQLELPKITEGQYHRPYVAVWIEDSHEQPVRLIALWREKPDWLKDLRRFWRKTGRSEADLVDARTGATKAAGRYALSWDGRNDQEQPVAQGSYQLVVEAAREHGGRNLVKQAFVWDGSAIDLKVPAGTELGQIHLFSKQ